MSDLKIDPALYGQLAEATFRYAIGVLERRTRRKASEMTPAEMLDGVRTLIVEFQTTDEVIAEERARIAAERHKAGAKQATAAADTLDEDTADEVEGESA